MEFKELKKKSVSELHKTLAESRDKLRDLRFKDASKQLKDVRQIRRIRTVIAQVMTLLNIEPTGKEVSSEKDVTKKVEKEVKKTVEPAKEEKK